MKLRHHRHSCLTVSLAGRSILVDPGSFSPQARTQNGLTAVLLTHQHPDHVDPDALDKLLLINPRLTIVAEPETAAAFGKAGRRIRVLKPGGYLELEQGIFLQGVGGRHAVIHPDIPRVGNLGVVLSAPGEPRLGITGDSLQDIGEFHRIDALAAPLVAPWSKISETIDFVRTVRPQRFIPVHDAIVSPEGREIYVRQVRDNLPEGTEFVDWPHDRTLSITGSLDAL